jgi:haloalkane dehalogenase
MIYETKPVSGDYSFESHYVDVLGSKIHYIDEGSGDPILFLHGIPASSYLWRNIIPSVSQYGRCIAPDLIGMGKSDKPDISYRIFDYIKYVDAFIESLGLEKVTLVLHGWGSVVGFDYAMRHESNVKAMAFLESHIRPEVGDNISLPVRHLLSSLKQKDDGFEHVVNSDDFAAKLLQNSNIRTLTQKELDHYKAPFQDSKHRQLIWQYILDLPDGDGPDDVIELIKNYSHKLTLSNIPKLMFYSIPGFQTTVDTIMWAKENLKNICLVDVGEGLHYPQENQPKFMANKMVEWMESAC